MMQNNKIVMLTVIGLILGAIVGTVIESAQVNLYMFAMLGGVVGFLAGWIWNSRKSDSAEE